jgi:hypothetical protein
VVSRVFSSRLMNETFMLGGTPPAPGIFFSDGIGGYLMGTLHYGSTEFAITVDDRALAHLQIVIITKLRRNESFQFAWVNSPAMENGQGGVWISPSIPLRFAFDSGPRPQLNKEWLTELSHSVDRSGTLQLTSEPAASPKRK